MTLNTKIELNKSAKVLKKDFWKLKSPQDVAKLLGIEYKTLIYYLYRLDENHRYVQYEIPKKSGGVRTISSPVGSLKIIQHKLNQVLQTVYKPKNTVHGFVEKRSILSNAKKHLKKKHILNLDIEDFYGKINFGRVRGMFMAHPHKLPAGVSTVLAQVCCYQNKLPQGAPTSPVVSNMICAKMDDELRVLAEKSKCKYSRYADDIVFSTSLSGIPGSLATINEFDNVVPGKILQEIIQNNGFSINLKKFRIKGKNERQEVTGITVNKFPNVKRSFIREVRAMLNAWEKYGLRNAQNYFREKYDKSFRSDCKKKPSYKYILRGKIEFIGMVRGREDPLYTHFLWKLKKLDPLLVRRPIDELDKLLEKYSALEKTKHFKARGYDLEKLFNELFKLNSIEVRKSFKRNKNGEQIDGAFKFDGWHYLVECRWREKLSSPVETDSLYGKVGRSGKQTMGFFLSINGWSKNIIPILEKSGTKQIILMDGKDLKAILERKVDLSPFIEAKITHLNQKSNPYLGWKDYLKLVS